ncbi:hypothetical protein DZE40_000710 [Clostridium beijerinckii]|uniref:Uncharacterized protein n=1 Tax=Clostridium beijerinckii TaxID=1520 RepID=A0A1S8SB76_CLOBE|nr:hypothetical protein [Clostridium beijerinckii]OOM62738.1 hypothetical protein CLBCK_15070 [Clostridium beijerinckii]
MYIVDGKNILIEFADIFNFGSIYSDNKVVVSV